MQKNLIRSCKLIIVSFFIFIILSGVAMIVYRGGSLHDRGAVHYNFFENYFSDLGATATVSGKQNTLSNILFITALGGIGLVLLFFSGIWRGMDIDVQRFSSIGYLSSFCLVVAGISFIGMAFTPWNIYFYYHEIYVKTAFVFLLAWTVLVTFLQARNVKIRKLLIANIIFVLILSWYVYTLFYGPRFGTDEDLEFQAVTQKAIFFVTISCLAFQAFGIQRFLRRADFRRASRKFYV